MPSAMRASTTLMIPAAACMRSRPSPIGHPIDRSLGSFDIERHAAIEERGGIEQAEHEVGVGHGRFAAAAAIASRSRIGAGALGPNAQHAAGIQARDRAAAGAERDDIEARHRHQLTGDAALRTEFRLSASDQGDISRCAAHVEGDEIGSLGQARRMPAAGDSASGPDSTVEAANRVASAIGATPPCESMMKTGPA